MNSIVTHRFVKCLEQLRSDKAIRSNRQFAISLNYLPQSLSDIVNGKRDVTLELVRKAVEQYQFNPVYLFAGNGPMFMSEATNNAFKVLTVVANLQEEEYIVHVPAAMHIAYARGTHDPGFIQSLPRFSLPDYQYQAKTFRSFEVDNDEMDPLLMPGYKVVGSYLEPELWLSGIKSGYVYVVVTGSNIFLRRVENELNESEKNLLLHPDNDAYATVSLKMHEISEVWLIKSIVAPFLPMGASAEATMKDEIRELKQFVTQQSKAIHGLQNVVEQFTVQSEE